MRIHVSILIVFSALVARLSFSSLSLVQHFHLIWLFDIGKGNWNYFAAIRNEKRNPKLEATHLEKAKELYTRVWFSGYSISFWLLCFAIFLDHFLISFCLNGTFCTFFFLPIIQVLLLNSFSMWVYVAVMKIPLIFCIWSKVVL